MKKAFSFVKGALIGALAGVTAGVLFAPKSGKETREDIKNKGVEIKDKFESAYNNASKEVHKKIANLKSLGEVIDETKYRELITDVINELKAKKALDPAVTRKLGGQMRKDWKNVKKTLAK